jgi:hypothetical protein
MSQTVKGDQTVKEPLGKVAAGVLCTWMALQLIGLFVSICLLWPRLLPVSGGAQGAPPAPVMAPIADLVPADLVDGGAKLLGQLKTSTSGLAKYLLGEPSSELSTGVTGFLVNTPPSAALQTALLKRLNTALSDPELSAKADPEVVKRLADPKNPKPSGDALRGLNRSLLATSFAGSFVERPAETPAPGASKTSGQGSSKTSQEGDLLLAVLLFGALGGAASATWTTAAFIGGRRMEESWVLWNLLRAPIGGALAIIYYCVGRGGILAADASVDKINVFFIAGTAGLVGLFTKVAMQKLQQAFGGKAPPTQSESLAWLTMPEVTGVNPPVLARNATTTTVKLAGSGFPKDAVVLLDGVPQKATVVAPTEIQVPVDPQSLPVGPKHFIVVVPSEGAELRSKPAELNIA